MRVPPLAAVLAIALLVRVGVLLIAPGALAADPDDYRRLAENIVEHGTFGRGDAPTAYRPPLYPLLLTGCFAAGDFTRAAIGALHVLLGLATVAIVFRLANRWGLDRRGAIFAALLVACDPILMFQSARVMTETPATLFAVLGLAALTCVGKPAAFNGTPRDCGRGENSAAALPRDRSRGALLPALLAGAVLGLGALCRPTTLVWIAAVGVALLFFDRKNSRRLTASGRVVRCLRLPAAFALGAAVVLSPWVIRNQMQFGRPIASTTHGGYTLLLANNPDFYQWLRSGSWGDVWRGDQFNALWNERRPRDELAADRLAYDEAWHAIRSEPGTFVYSCFVRLGRLWSPLPHRLATEESAARRSSRYAVDVWYMLEYLLAAAGVWRIAKYRNATSDLLKKSVLETSGATAGLPSSVCEKTPENTAGQASSGTLFQQPARTSAAAQHFAGTWLWGMLLVLSLSCVHSIYWTDMRMRAVVMPVVALAAAAGALRREESRVAKPPSIV
ncbi:MAG: phospholipid carrier-dependent glycosyltransferase [Pirellulaceae bacterium]|nr:phospholipid carrier-dependent glycosyltransferase [Pirellulaceae bacterium]